MKWINSQQTYEKYDLDKLNDKDLEIFWRIIQDTWSYYFKEYLSCDTCETVFSKKDIFKTKEKNYRNYTIEELEIKFWFSQKCWCTEWNLTHIWWEDYLISLEKSLTDNIHTTLITCKNSVNEIIWFVYANVDPLEKIYTNDLSYDFRTSDLLKIPLKKRLNENFLLTTGLSIIERETNKDTAYELLSFLYKCIPLEFQNIPWIIATIYRTPVYKLYEKLWAEDFNLTSKSKQKVRLMYAENMAYIFNKKLSFILE